MAHTRRLAQGRQAASSANPFNLGYTANAGDTVLVVLLKIIGATNRAGGSLFLRQGTSDSVSSSLILTQANSTQKAAASPEASVEIWYLVKPPMTGTWFINVPNTGAASIIMSIEVGQAQEGMTSEFDGDNGSNGTSTNPTAGAIVTTKDGDIGWAIVANGANTWAPTAPTGTLIADTDDGNHGGSEYYFLQSSAGSFTFSCTAASEDWGMVAVFFKEVAGLTVPNNYKFMKAGSGMSVSEKIR